MERGCFRNIWRILPDVVRRRSQALLRDGNLRERKKKERREKGKRSLIKSPFLLITRRLIAGFSWSVTQTSGITIPFSVLFPSARLDLFSSLVPPPRSSERVSHSHTRDGTRWNRVPISTQRARGNIYKRYVFHSGGARTARASPGGHVCPINRWDDKVSIWKGRSRAPGRTRGHGIFCTRPPSHSLSSPFFPYRYGTRRKPIVPRVSKLCGGDFNFGPVPSARRNCEIPQPYRRAFLPAARRRKIRIRRYRATRNYWRNCERPRRGGRKHFPK